MPHRVNQSMLRPEFNAPGNEIPLENGFHQPPGSMGARVMRGRIGPKYESWSDSVQTANKALRNCECLRCYLTWPSRLSRLLATPASQRRG